MPDGERDKPTEVLFQFGHPFEHQLFDAQEPKSLMVFTPDGKKIDLSKALEKTSAESSDGKKMTAFKAVFTPERRGDFTFVAAAAPVWVEDEKEFFLDTAKVVLHVQTQKGWDSATGQDLEWVPLTRPYGLQSGMVFQAQALADGKPLAGALVEVERYNATAPKTLPDDEQITRKVKTDPNGIATCTLTDPGWWCLTTQRDGGKRERDGKMYPVRQRTTFWVFVDRPKN